MQLEKIISEAWDNRALLNETTTQEAIKTTIELLDKKNNNLFINQLEALKRLQRKEIFD